MGSGAETRSKTNLVLSKAEKDTGGNHFQYSDRSCFTVERSKISTGVPRRRRSVVQRGKGRSWLCQSATAFENGALDRLYFAGLYCQWRSQKLSMKGVWSRGTEIEGWGLGNYKMTRPLHAKIYPISSRVVGPQKNFKIYQFFKTIFVISINYISRACPLCDYYEIFRDHRGLHVESAIKIWGRFASRIEGLTLRWSGYPQIFSAT